MPFYVDVVVVEDSNPWLMVGWIFPCADLLEDRTVDLNRIKPNQQTIFLVPVLAS